MYFVKVPSSVQAVDPETNDPLRVVDGTGRDHGAVERMNMHRFVMRYVVNSAELRGYEDYRACERLDRAFREQAPGAVVQIESADYDRCRRVLSSLSLGSGVLGVQYLPFMRALMDASDAAPEAAPEAVPVGTARIVDRR